MGRARGLEPVTGLVLVLVLVPVQVLAKAMAQGWVQATAQVKVCPANRHPHWVGPVYRVYPAARVLRVGRVCWVLLAGWAGWVLAQAVVVPVPDWGCRIHRHHRHHRRSRPTRPH